MLGHEQTSWSACSSLIWRPYVMHPSSSSTWEALHSSQHGLERQTIGCARTCAHQQTDTSLNGTSWSRLRSPSTLQAPGELTHPLQIHTLYAIDDRSTEEPLGKADSPTPQSGGTEPMAYAPAGDSRGEAVLADDTVHMIKEHALAQGFQPVSRHQWQAHQSLHFYSHRLHLDHFVLLRVPRGVRNHSSTGLSFRSLPVRSSGPWCSLLRVPPVCVGSVGRALSPP